MSLKLEEKLAIIELISKAEDKLHEYETSVDLSNSYISNSIKIIEIKKERIKMYIEMIVDKA